MVIGAVTVSVNVHVAVSPPKPVAVIEKLKIPACVGVPERVDRPAKEIPGGSEPDVTDDVFGQLKSPGYTYGVLMTARLTGPEEH
jgi:hypothetical protein